MDYVKFLDDLQDKYPFLEIPARPTTPPSYLTESFSRFSARSIPLTPYTSAMPIKKRRGFLMGGLMFGETTQVDPLVFPALDEADMTARAIKDSIDLMRNGLYESNLTKETWDLLKRRDAFRKMLANDPGNESIPQTPLSFFYVLIFVLNI